MLGIKEQVFLSMCNGCIVGQGELCCVSVK